MPVEQDATLFKGAVEDGYTVSINVPSGVMVHAGFARDLTALMGFTTAHFVREGVLKSISLNTVTGTYIHKARQQLAAMTLKQGADYSLWLDSDMRFPKDALARLLMHERPIVGCNYAMRGAPTNYVGIKRIPHKDDRDGERLLTTEKKEGLEPCEALGFGCILIRSDVFLSLPDPRDMGPWFNFRWDPDIQQVVGEDVFFAQLVKEAGWEILCDHDLSKRITHLGEFDYRLDQVQAQYEHNDQQRPDFESAEAAQLKDQAEWRRGQNGADNKLQHASD